MKDAISYHNSRLQIKREVLGFLNQEKKIIQNIR